MIKLIDSLLKMDKVIVDFFSLRKTQSNVDIAMKIKKKFETENITKYNWASHEKVFK